MQSDEGEDEDDEKSATLEVFFRPRQSIIPLISILPPSLHEFNPDSLPSAPYARLFIRLLHFVQSVSFKETILPTPFCLFYSVLFCWPHRPLLCSRPSLARLILTLKLSKYQMQDYDPTI